VAVRSDSRRLREPTSQLSMTHRERESESVPSPSAGTRGRALPHWAVGRPAGAGM
jgi:hypothetical protein